MVTTTGSNIAQKDTTRNSGAFKAVAIGTDKCKQCPVQANSGTVCWQGTPNCIIHGSNLADNKGIARELNRYANAMHKAQTHDELAHAERIVQWQLETASWNNNFFVKLFRAVFA